MKYIFTILLLIGMYPSLGQARPRFEGGPRQQRNPRVQQQRFNNNNSAAKRVLKAEKIQRAQEIKEAYIKAKLNLTPEQNEKFMPLYRQYATEIAQTQAQIHQLQLNPQANSADQIQQEEDLDMKLSMIRRRYNQEFLKIMPPEKVLQINRSEAEFRDEVVQQLKEKRNDSPN